MIGLDRSIVQFPARKSDRVCTRCAPGKRVGCCSTETPKLALTSWERDSSHCKTVGSPTLGSLRTAPVPSHAAAGTPGYCPVTAKDQPLKIDANVLDQLQALRAHAKFEAASVDVGPRLAEHMNELIDRLIANLALNPTKAYVLAEFTCTLKSFEREDSEDQDAALQYLENIMDILQIESSDGLLNHWRYGFDPSQRH
jgi:hypothetical protein